MWKRPNKAPPASRVIGAPVLLESSLDEDSAAKLQDLSEVQRRNGTGLAETSNVPATDDGPRVPAAPWIRPENNDDNYHNDNDNGHHYYYTVDTPIESTQQVCTDSLTNAEPPAMPLQYSSTATSRSGNNDSLRPARLDIPRPTSGYSHEVSPPDSPRTGDFERSSPNVSPITDGGNSRGGSSASRQPSNTSIPMPTASNALNVPALGGWRDKPLPQTQPKRKDSKPTRWDKYSGEPTESDQGWRGQQQPGTTRFDQLPMGNISTVTSVQGTPSPRANLFSQTLKRVSKREGSSSPTPSGTREEWKGASGRHAIVETPVDKPAGHKKSLPTPSQRRKKQIGKSGAGAKLYGAMGAANTQNDSPPAGLSSPSRSYTDPKIPKATSPTPQEPVIEDDAEHGRSRIADQFARTQRFSLSGSNEPAEMPGRTSSLPPSQVTSPITPSRQARSNQPSPAADTSAESPGPHGIEFQVHSYTDPRFVQAVEQLGFRNEPGSRFSATTYATSTNTGPESRPDTPEGGREASSPPSVLNRKRPIPAQARFPGEKPSPKPAGGKAPSRKPTPSQMLGADGESTMGIDPPPPPSPPEPVEVDKVTQLEKHMANLHKRKQNLMTVINELTNVAQPTSIAYDRTSRSEIKKTVGGMSTELASVTKEIHDTGLRLHRALKKRDQEMSGEGSGLWIRRVTE